MLKNLKKLIITAAASFGLLVPLAVPVMVSAQSDANIPANLCAGAKLDVTANGQACQPEEASEPINTLIGDIINIFSIVVGVVAVVMIIVGGLRYITSGGDSGNITSAKNTILYAIIGLVVVAIAQFVVRFILGRLTGAVSS